MHRQSALPYSLQLEYSCGPNPKPTEVNGSLAYTIHSQRHVYEVPSTTLLQAVLSDAAGRVSQ